MKWNGKFDDVKPVSIVNVEKNVLGNKTPTGAKYQAKDKRKPSTQNKKKIYILFIRIYLYLA